MTIKVNITGPSTPPTTSIISKPVQLIGFVPLKVVGIVMFADMSALEKYTMHQYVQGYEIYYLSYQLG